MREVTAAASALISSRPVEEILTLLDAASTPQTLDLPGYRLHRLKGNLRGFWSLTVRANWRIIFRFQEGDAWDVELTDYH